MGYLVKCSRFSKKKYSDNNVNYRTYFQLYHCSSLFPKGVAKKGQHSCLVEKNSQKSVCKSDDGELCLGIWLRKHSFYSAAFLYDCISSTSSIPFPPKNREILIRPPRLHFPNLLLG